MVLVANVYPRVVKREDIKMDNAVSQGIGNKCQCVSKLEHEDI